MPIYTYECEHCGQRFDAKQSFSDAPLTICPNCEGKIHRVIQPVGVVFKGSGFYITDSKAKQNLATTGTKKEDTKSTDSGDGAGSHSHSSTEGSAAPTTTETAAKPAAETTKSTSDSK